MIWELIKLIKNSWALVIYIFNKNKSFFPFTRALFIDRKHIIEVNDQDEMDVFEKITKEDYKTKKSSNVHKTL